MPRLREEFDEFGALQTSPRLIVVVDFNLI